MDPTRRLQRDSARFPPLSARTGHSFYIRQFKEPSSAVRQQKASAAAPFSPGIEET